MGNKQRQTATSTVYCGVVIDLYNAPAHMHLDPRKTKQRLEIPQLACITLRIKSSTSNDNNS